MTESDTRTTDRADKIERKLAVPVIVAALVSVPAVFLTSMEGAAAQVGTVLNWASLVVLTGESLVLFMVAENRIQWLKEHRGMVAVALLAIPAVVFAVGPAQVLRLIRFVGALRVIRVNRILKAGRILRNRAELQGVWRNAVAIGVTVIAALFVALVLTDQTSQSGQWVQGLTQRFGLAPVVVAGLILGVATFVVVRNRVAREEEDEDADESDST